MDGWMDGWMEGDLEGRMADTGTMRDGRMEGCGEAEGTRALQHRGAVKSQKKSEKKGCSPNGKLAPPPVSTKVISHDTSVTLDHRGHPRLLLRGSVAAAKGLPAADGCGCAVTAVVVVVAVRVVATGTAAVGVTLIR
jgi:hypothetical protein